MRRPLCLACLVVAAFIFIFSRLFPEQEKDFSALEKQQVILEGTLSGKDYKTKDGKQVLVLTLSHAMVVSATEEIISNETTLAALPKDFCAQCTLSSDGMAAVPPMLHSRIRISGKLYPFHHATNPGESDQLIYNQSIGLDCSLYNAAVTECVEEGSLHSLDEQLFQLRQKLGRILEQAFSAEDASIMKAMLLGAKGDLSADIRQLYKDSGIIHILAISGLHISMIGMSLYRFLKKCRLPIPVRCGLPIVTMLLYGRMTGMSASSFRAIFMFVLHMSARLVHRTYDLLTAVSIAGVLLLIQEPLYLDNSGFLFSFGAVLAIGILAPAMPSFQREAQADDALANHALASSPKFAETILVQRSAKSESRPSPQCSSVRRTCHTSRIRPDSPALKWAGRIWTLLQTPLSVTLVTLPVHLQFYGTFPVYSILLNLLVLPMMSAVMALGLATLGLGLVWLPAGILVGLPVRLVLFFYKQLCLLSLQLPGHTIVPGNSAIWQYVLYYSLLVLFVVSKDKLSETKRSLLCIAALMLLLVRIQPGLSLDVIDVGQGDGMLVRYETSGFGGILQSRRSFRMMIDGGSTSKSNVGKYQVAPFLCARGTGTISLWLVTHGDADHTSGLIEILEEENSPIVIERIALPSYQGCMEVNTGNGSGGTAACASAGNMETNTGISNGDTAACASAGSQIAKIEELARKKGIPVVYVKEGDTISAISTLDHAEGPASGLTLTCLHPQKEASYSDANEYSVTLFLKYGSFTALLTGDLEGQGEEDFLEYWKERRPTNDNAPAKITLLKVAHHGSSGATSAAFLSAFRPQLSVISCGWNNSYGHPHQETLERLQQAGTRIYDTRYTGEICFHTDGKTIAVEKYMAP